LPSGANKKLSENSAYVQWGAAKGLKGASEAEVYFGLVGQMGRDYFLGRFLPGRVFIAGKSAYDMYDGFASGDPEKAGAAAPGLLVLMPDIGEGTWRPYARATGQALRSTGRFLWEHYPDPSTAGMFGFSWRRRLGSSPEINAMREIAPPSNQGMQNPIVRNKVENGVLKHEMLQERMRRKGWLVDRAETGMIDPATGETVYPDAITPTGHPVEIKPRTPTGVEAGKSQLPQYERATGKRGRVIYYLDETDWLR
jgi:hypothetical protein